MNTNRQNAYRYLLYRALIDIRMLQWGAQSWCRSWWPFSWWRAKRAIDTSVAIADCMHNLALFISIDFAGFDEGRFWHELDRLRETGRLPWNYRHAFDQQLNELNSQS